MSHTTYPLTEHLQSGISAADAKELLSENDCLSFPQLKSGLFPAAKFDNLEKDETGMADAWLRDSACIGIILLSSGSNEVAARAARGVINKLQQVRKSFEDVIDAGKAPEDNKKRPPVRYEGQDSIPRYDWANAQNDALGYSLQFIGLAAKAGVIKLTQSDIQMLDLIIEYLAVISYWQDAESGHWEEIKKVNASSVGTVIGGLQLVHDYATEKSLIDELIQNGSRALETILPSESLTTGLERTDDSALIFLVEPQGVVQGLLAEQIIQNSIQNLMGERGFRRYNGDSYWGPDYREHFLTGDRAADFSEPSEMARRDKYVYKGSEAQWTFFDPLVSVYYARSYQRNGNEEDAAASRKFMARSLGNIIEYKNTETNRTVWRIPELFFIENGEWVPNDHLGLLWGEANYLFALNVYEEVFGDNLINN